MRPVVKRIALNGLLVAGVLGLLGLVYAELAGMWLAGGGVPRGGPVEAAGTPAAAADGQVQDVIRYRVPALMALWGFLFVAASELILYAIRGEPAAKVAAKKGAAQPDDAEVLLEELLKQAEAASAKEAAAKHAVPDDSAAHRPLNGVGSDGRSNSILTPDSWQKP